MDQVPFNITVAENFAEEDYFVTDVNYAAKKWLDSWPKWGESKLNNITLIVGSSGSGKSHLASIWKRKSDGHELNLKELIDREYYHLEKSAFLFENIDRFSMHESDLFHLFNFILNNDAYLVVTCSKHISNLNFSLPDLKSRIAGFMQVKLYNPDVSMIEQILLKSFSDRHIKIDWKTIEYISKRIDRSYPAIKKIVEELDRLSLADKRKLTIPFIHANFGI